MTHSFHQSRKYPCICVGRFLGPTPAEFNPLGQAVAQESAFHVNILRLSPAENPLWLAPKLLQRPDLTLRTVSIS